MLEGKDILIDNGVLQVRLQYSSSCGSYSVTNQIFSFRYEDKRFRLIGLDINTFSRNTGDITESSSNYLTGKRKITTGLNEFEDSEAVIAWQDFPVDSKVFLDGISAVCATNSQEPWCQ